MDAGTAMPLRQAQSAVHEPLPDYFSKNGQKFILSPLDLTTENQPK
jgi:hypothetical protein